MARKSAAQVDRETWQAEARREEAVAARREMLLRQIQARFDEVPSEIRRTVEGTQDTAQLDDWIVRFATAKTLADIGIQAPAVTP